MDAAVAVTGPFPKEGRPVPGLGAGAAALCVELGTASFGTASFGTASFGTASFGAAALGGAC